MSTLPRLLLLLVGISTTSFATPAANPPKCPGVKNTCADSASAFCYSYLSIPETATVTKTRAKVRSKTKTITDEVTTSTPTSGITTTTVYSLATEYVDNDSTVTDTTTLTGACPTLAIQDGQKRRRAAEPTPACLANFQDGPQLSSACSCFGLTAHSTKTTIKRTKAVTTKHATATVTTDAVPSSTEIHVSVTSTTTITNDPPHETSVVYVPGPASASTVQGTADDSTFTYQNIDNGCNLGWDEADTSGYSSSHGSLQHAAEACAHNAAYGSSAFQIQLISDGAEENWYCMTYNGDVGSMDYKSETYLDKDVLQAYLYSA